MATVRQGRGRLELRHDHMSFGMGAAGRSSSQDHLLNQETPSVTTASRNPSFDSLHPGAHGRARFTKNAIAGRPNRSRTVGERCTDQPLVRELADAL